MAESNSRVLLGEADSFPYGGVEFASPAKALRPDQSRKAASTVTSAVVTRGAVSLRLAPWVMKM